MDLLLENGELKKSPSGRPIPISGLEELKQRIYIRLKARLGSFIYDRELGSEINADSGEGELKELIRRALPELFDSELISASIEESILKLEFDSAYGSFELEIDFKEGQT